MLILLSFLISSVAAADLVTTNITYALGAPFSYGPTVLPAQTAMVFNFTYSSCMGRVLINVTGMVPDDVIIIESFSTPDVYQETMGKLAQRYIDTRKSPPYICATFKATKGSEMNFTLHAEKTCSTGGKGDNSDPKSSLNLSILGSISCFLLYILVK